LKLPNAHLIGESLTAMSANVGDRGLALAQEFVQ